MTTTPPESTQSTPPAAASTTSSKAIFATVISFVLAFATAVQLAITSGADLSNWLTWLNAVLAAIITGGATGGVTYAVPNKVKQ